MTVESTIDYEGLAQEAMRGVVRKVLVSTAKSGLVGDHHFYISFETEAPGVSMSKRLREKYPREMTIVLQHRFWDLAVTEDRFEVKLTFDGIPERLVVPFAAIKVFFDPSVRFGLQFEDPAADAEAQTRDPGNAYDALPTRAGSTRSGHTRKQSRRKTQILDGANAKTPEPNGNAGEDGAGAAAAAAELAATPGERTDGDAAPGTETPEPQRQGAEIVSLDKFRKK